MANTAAEPDPIYIFDRDQLIDLLGKSIEMFLEFRTHHARTTEQALSCAVMEMVDGLDSERMLAEEAGHIVTAQIIPTRLEHA